ncbi:hypothetical protein CLU79DRAFT_888381 [Phycomyces nitens]|nr:hypothetical protein CLU79DRAFT_888381 [Phycomyces nitens]
MSPCLGPKNGNKVKKKHGTLDSTQKHGPFWIVYKDSTFLHFPLILHIFTSSHTHTLQCKFSLSKSASSQSASVANPKTPPTQPPKAFLHSHLPWANASKVSLQSRKPLAAAKYKTQSHLL